MLRSVQSSLRPRLRVEVQVRFCGDVESFIASSTSIGRSTPVRSDSGCPLAALSAVESLDQEGMYRFPEVRDAEGASCALDPREVRPGDPEMDVAVQHLVDGLERTADTARALGLLASAGALGSKLVFLPPLLPRRGSWLLALDPFRH